MKELLDELEMYTRLKAELSEITFWLVMAYAFIVILLIAIALLWFRYEY